MTATAPLRLLANATTARLDGADRETMLAVSELLSYTVDGAEFITKASGSGWSGKSSFFSMRTGSFPAGFFHGVHQLLLKRGLKPQIAKKPIPAPLGPENPIVDAFGNDDPNYDFQMEALRSVERHGRGIIQVATGGGKSKVAKLIAARFRRMTLFITTRGVLMYQMKEGFESAGFNVGVVGDGIWAPVRGINVGMVQTLVSQLEETTADAEARKVMGQVLAAEGRAVDALKAKMLKAKDKPPAILKAVDLLIAHQEKTRLSNDEIIAKGRERFRAATLQRAKLIHMLELVEVVIGEEAHEAGGNSYFEILKHCKNAQVRVALTATPYMRPDAEANLRLMAAFGGVLCIVSERTLIDRGILARPFFKFVVSKPHKLLKKLTPWAKAYKYGYVDNPFMHADIVADAQRAASYGLPVLTLIQQTSHGLALAHAMKAAGLRVSYIQGKDDQDVRKRELHRLEKGLIDVLIGSTIVDVGVDVPAIGLVQLAGGGKAEIALRQRIGRGARRKKTGPNVFFVADYTSAPNEHFRMHAAGRRQIIAGTDGFHQGILPPGQDFPWELYDQERAAA